MGAFSLRNFTRQVPPRFSYGRVAQTVLPKWDISLVFAGRVRAQGLNRTPRNKSYVPNVLSYSAGEKNGEIIICLETARRQAPRYGMPFSVFVLYLFIHGLLHLKGYRHGGTMEDSEHALVKRFTNTSTPIAHHVSTHRHRY